MAKEYNIRCRLHKRFSYLVVIKTRAGKVLRSGKVNNSKERLTSFLELFRDDPLLHL